MVTLLKADRKMGFEGAAAVKQLLLINTALTSLNLERMIWGETERKE